MPVMTSNSAAAPATGDVGGDAPSLFGVSSFVVERRDAAICRESLVNIGHERQCVLQSAATAGNHDQRRNEAAPALATTLHSRRGMPAGLGFNYQGPITKRNGSSPGIAFLPGWP